MTVQEWTFVMVGMSFAVYILIAFKSRAKSTSDFYVAGKGVNPVSYTHLTLPTILLV